MLFKTSSVAALALTGAAIAVPVQPNGVQDISVLLTSTAPGTAPWLAGGFSSTEASTATDPNNHNAFTHVRLLFSHKVKKEQPNLVTGFRCALRDENGDRIIVTRGENVDFTFADNNNPAPWELKNGPFKKVSIECDPTFQKFNQNNVNTVSVALSNSGADLARQAIFKDTNGQEVLSQRIGGDFTTATLTLGPGVYNQKLRCQLTGPDGSVVLLNRGTNLNKKTFGDAGKGEWDLDVAGDGVATVKTVTCDPAFV